MRARPGVLVTGVVVSALAGCGSSQVATSSSSHPAITLDTETKDSTFASAEIPAGSYSVQLNQCAHKLDGFLVLAEATTQGGFDPSNAPTLHDGGSVSITQTDKYAVIPFGSDINSVAAALANACYPQVVTLTAK